MVELLKSIFKNYEAQSILEEIQQRVCNVKSYGFKETLLPQNTFFSNFSTATLWEIYQVLKEEKEETQKCFAAENIKEYGSNKSAFIVGEDDRINVSMIYNFIDNAESVAVMIGNIGKREKHQGIVEYPFFREKKIEGNDYSDEEKIANVIGTAFLVSHIIEEGVEKSVFLTAGHCIEGQKVKNIDLVFGYKIIQNKTITNFPISEIYTVKKKIHIKKLGIKNMDVAFLFTEKVKDRKPLRLKEEETTKGEKAFAIGYPEGLALKLALNGKIDSATSGKEQNFKVNLDLFFRNSGSPVFDSASNKVIGIVQVNLTEDDTKEGKDGKQVATQTNNIETYPFVCTSIYYFINQLKEKKLYEKYLEV